MYGIAACVTGPTKVDIFWLDREFKLTHKSGDGTQWDIGWDDLGGTFITVPAAAATNSAQLGFPQMLDVFAVGTDFAMYTKGFGQGTWSANWLNLQGTFSSGPAVIGRDTGQLDLFAVGTDLAMYHRKRSGRWSPGWEYLGGRFSSTASIVSRGVTSIDVFARGADFTLRHRRNVSGVWSDGWQNLGGSLASPPVAVSWGPNRIDVFAVGSDGAMWHRWWDSEMWNDWESLGGSLTQTPAVVSWAPGHLDAFALRLDGALHHFPYDNQAWNGPEQVPGVAPAAFTSGPTALSPVQNRVNLLGPVNHPVTGSAMYGKVWDGTTWTPANFDQISGQPGLPTQYRFSVDYVHVTTARSANSDTDAAVASLGVGNSPVQTAIQRIGDIGGTSPDSAQLNLLDFEPVTLELCEVASFHYTIMNAGHVDAKVLDTALIKAAGSITGDSVKAISTSLGAGIGAIVGVEIVGTTIIAPVIGSLLGSLVEYLRDKLGEIVFADCDGLVASESPTLSGRDVYLKTVDAPLSVTTTHPGTDSPTGCGANSVYEVTWSIRRL